ncbi:ubiquinone anaerobic biosynthesis accessory factor UbiT [Chitinibacteraceae bacterium HSL-7]
MRVPEFKVPAPLAFVLGKLPPWPPAFVLCQSLNLMARRGVLPVEHEWLAGKRFTLTALDAGTSLHLMSDGQRFVPCRAHAKADLQLSATVADFARLMLREEDPDTLFFEQRLQIEGETELGLVVKNLLDAVDWDGTPLASLFRPA